MKAIEARVAALEMQASPIDSSLQLIFAEAGETRAAALKRAGYPPDADDVMCLEFVSPTDARL